MKIRIISASGEARVLFDSKAGAKRIKEAAARAGDLKKTARERADGLKEKAREQVDGLKEKAVKKKEELARKVKERLTKEPEQDPVEGESASDVEKEHPFVLRTARALEGAFDQVREDITAVRTRDPAAKSDLEVLLLYSGLHAVLAYRLSHYLHEHGLELGARAISQGAKFFTGIEIHPAAKIGRRLFIDHGTGVVIGETSVIGDDCTIYQGATLGGTGKETGKRHPTVGNGVMIGTGAKILGPVKIGDHTKIAAGAVVLKDIPDHCTAVGIPARIVKQYDERVEDLDQIHIPDPVEKEFAQLREEIEELKEKMQNA